MTTILLKTILLEGINLSKFRLILNWVHYISHFCQRIILQIDGQCQLIRFIAVIIPAMHRRLNVAIDVPAYSFKTLEEEMDL